MGDGLTEQDTETANSRLKSLISGSLNKIIQDEQVSDPRMVLKTNLIITYRTDSTCSYLHKNRDCSAD